mgnify:CR=1 FL=1
MTDNIKDTTKQDTDQQDTPVVADETPAEEIAEQENVEVTEETTVDEESVEDDSTDQTEEKLPEFRAGDTVRVFYKIIEGDKMRIQPFEGIVISFRGSDVSKTFTVRRIGADQVGVERIFPLHSPNIEKIKVMKRGNVRRAKLYYLRDKVGREAMRVKEIKK